MMLLYSHLVLATDLSSFLGDQAWVNNETVRQLHDGAFGFSDLGRSYLWHISNPLIALAASRFHVIGNRVAGSRIHDANHSSPRLAAATDVSASADRHSVRS